MYLDTTTALAREHDRQVREDVRSARLAAVAACCRPPALLRAVRRSVAWLRAGQLGPVANYCGCA